MPGKRPSMKGIGADAFFSPASAPQVETPVNQQDAISVSQYDSKPAAQAAAAPAEQYEKATFYLGRRHVMRLEQLRLERMGRGEKVDKSALVREAIENLPQ